MKRRICIFTGTRADYGLLKPLMDEVKKDDSLQIQVLVTGMHLSKEYGSTYKEIEKDGFKINAKINIKLNNDSAVGISKSSAIGLEEYAKSLKNLKPDLLVILGDRFEALSAATAAMIANIPIAHLHGGEATHGLIDEAIRHSITKMSHLHFTATEIYRKRVIQLGESPANVFNVGAIGLDNIRTLKLLKKDELEDQLKFKFNKKNFLVTYHPVTLSKNASKKNFKNLLDTLDSLNDTNLIFTYANADTDGKVINQLIETYVKRNAQKALAVRSLGQLRYLSAMQYVDGVIGNSSSGLIEAPSFKIGTINIGERQNGRLQASSTINCKAIPSEINKAIHNLYSNAFQAKLKRIVNPYGDGRAAPKIKDILKKTKLDHLLMKSFHDLDVKPRRGNLTRV